MSSQSLTEGRIARSRHGLEASDEIHFPRGGDIKGVPGELGRGDVDARVQGEEAGLCVFVIRELSLSLRQQVSSARVNSHTKPWCATAGRAR
jgi:hypothetical protein